MTTPLPPGRERRANLLLIGRLDVRDAHPLEVAAATRHVLTHQLLDADTWRMRRDTETRALAELRATLGSAPWVYCGEAALRALAAAGPAPGCVRCRANALARVHKLRPPGFDEATSYLLGPPCDRCKPKSQPVKTRPGGAASHLRSSGPAPSVRPTRVVPAQPTREAIASWLTRRAAGDPILGSWVKRWLDRVAPLGSDPARGVGLGWERGLPDVSDTPVDKR